MPEQQASRPFQVGDRVRIRPSSGYYNHQPHRRNVDTGDDRNAIGLVTDISRHFNISVHWAELNYANVYVASDLVLVDAPQSTETPYAKDIILVLGRNEYVLAQAIVSSNQNHEDLVGRFCSEYSSVARNNNVMALTISEARQIVEKLLSQLEVHQDDHRGVMLDWRDR
jgi:hypothetical protein